MNEYAIGGFSGASSVRFYLQAHAVASGVSAVQRQTVVGLDGQGIRIRLRAYVEGGEVAGDDFIAKEQIDAENRYAVLLGYFYSDGLERIEAGLEFADLEFAPTRNAVTRK